LIRSDHQSDNVSLNTQLASTLQRQLNDLRSSNLNDVEECWAACVGPVESQDRTLCGSGRRCDSTVRKLYADATNTGGCRSDSIAITVYKESDSSKLWDFWSSGRATQRAYDSAIFNYEFSRNRPRNRDASSTHGFTNIVWASTTQVGFAMRGNLGVLAYSTPAANDQTCTDCARAGDIGTQCGSNSCRAGGSCSSTLSGFCANVKSNRYDSCETKQCPAFQVPANRCSTCVTVNTAWNEVINSDGQTVRCDDPSRPIGILNQCVSQGYSGADSQDLFYTFLTKVPPHFAGFGYGNNYVPFYMNKEYGGGPIAPSLRFKDMSKTIDTPMSLAEIKRSGFNKIYHLSLVAKQSQEENFGWDITLLTNN